MRDVYFFVMGLCTLFILASLVLHSLWEPFILCGIPFVVVGLMCAVIALVTPLENMVK